MTTAVVRFSGICTHVQKGHGPLVDPSFDPDAHYVMLAYVSHAELYREHVNLRNLPPHVAQIVVARDTIVGAQPPLCLYDDGARDAVTYRLHDDAKITIAPAYDAGPPAPLRYERWDTIPRIHALLPLLPPGQHRPVAPEIARRRAATLAIRSGTITAVDYDIRSGDAAAEWELDAPAGLVTLSIDGPEPQTFTLRVPRRDSLPRVPLIQIENVGRDRDDPYDFYFHYYLLFGHVPDGSNVPHSRHIVEGGTSTGCSNSNYP
jgi:hypothetical protein